MTRKSAKVTQAWKQSALNRKESETIAHQTWRNTHTSILSHTLIKSNITYSANLKDPVTTMSLY